MNGTVKDFRCNGCGAPLPIPKNSKGHVTCPSCRNECVLEGLAKNAEIAAKENINSGISLLASPAALHNKLVSLLSKQPHLPLDAFGQIEVVREERYCVPAYCFYCNGTSSFTYEKGVDTSQLYNVKTKKGIATQERIHTEWHPGSSSASVSSTVFAPGNRKLAPLIKKLYAKLDPNKLIDFEELDFPVDVETYNYDLPQPAAFTEYVVPNIEKLLQEKATGSVSGQNVRNFSSGGSSIQKDVVRVFLGLYNVVFKYRDKEYSVWFTGDGEKLFYEYMPEDTNRKRIFEEKRQAKASIPLKTKWLTFGMWACIVGAVFTIATVIGAIIFGAGAIVCGVFKSKKKKEYTAQQAKAQSEIDAFVAQLTDVVQKFKGQQKVLHGIYEGVDVSAANMDAEDMSTFDATRIGVDVIMMSGGSNKIKVIKEVRMITGLGLAEAKALVDNTPTKIKESINNNDANAIRGKLVAAGATVEIR